MQDVYNGIGIVLANRENNSEALPYLTKACEAYDTAIKACKEHDKAAALFSNSDDSELAPVDQYLLQNVKMSSKIESEGAKTEAATTKYIKPVILGGLELNVLEAGYT